MNVPRLFKRNPIRWRTLHKAVTICILASLLAGLIPPPLVRSVLPPLAADLAETLLPEPLTAFAQTADFGDLPTAAQSGFANNYPTTSAGNGPSHTIAAILRMGAQIDSEADGQPTATADGDDTNDTPDDEDGVQFKTPLRPGANGIIAIGIQQPLSSTVYVNGWIDFNQDGDFADSGEQIATDVTSINGNVRTDTSSVLLDFAIPSDAISGFTYARFRSCTAAGSCNTPTGSAADGEVEDYQVSIPTVAQLGNYVWLDSSGDGVQQGGEPGVEGVLVQLYRVSDDALVDVAATDATGYYSFTNLLPDTYYLKFVAASGYTFTTALQGGNAANDSDANQSTGRTGNIVLAGGDNDQSWDTGLITTANQLTYCKALPWGPTEVIHTFSLPKFNPALGTLTGVSISDYVGLQQWIGGENRAVNAQNSRITTTSDASLTLPDSTTLDTSVGLNTGVRSYAVYDGITDMSGASSFSYSDWQYVLNTNSASYATLSDFIAASPGQTVDLPFETLSGFTTTGGGGNIAAIQRTYALAGVCVNYSYTPVPNPGGFSLSKAIATTDGSSPSVSGTFDVVVTCPGVSGYPATISLNADGTPVSAGNLVSGTVCSFSENTLTLPTAPTGYTWVNATISPASITIASNLTATVTATNWLAPLPTPPTNVLTVTKTISGTGSGPFDITIAGPSGYMTNTQIDDGDVLTFNVPSSGLYTVTESTPAGWTTIYTATTGYSTGSSAVVTLTNSITATTFGPVQITGTVYSDYNSDGNITTNAIVSDTGVQSVTVSIYNAVGSLVGTATTNASGHYTITPSSAGPYRVEFTTLPTGYEPSRVFTGTQNGTSVQFINSAAGASNVNFGVLQPSDYSQNNPLWASTFWYNGTPSDASNATSKGVAAWNYNSSGNLQSSPARVLADFSEVGTVWGVAYNPTNAMLYSSALVRRHAGLGPLGAGNGIGTIYQSTPAGVVSLLYDFGTSAGTIGTNATRGLTTNSSPSTDATAFALVGKAGLGDIDISLDYSRLYVVNLNDRHVYYISTQSPAAGSALAAGTMPWIATNPCIAPAGGTARPWGLKVADLGFGERVFAGVVCDAAGGTKSNLQALVYEYNPTTNTWRASPVLTTTLDYVRQASNMFDGTSTTSGFVANNSDAGGEWHPWQDSFATMTGSDYSRNGGSYAQPILSGIELDNNGDMILAFTDRGSLQMGWNNNDPDGTLGEHYVVAGEVLRAGLNNVSVAPTWTIENNGVTTGVNGTRTSTAAPRNITDQGGNSRRMPESSGFPTGTGREFYWGEGVAAIDTANGFNSQHWEGAVGALAMLPGANDVMATQMDPNVSVPSPTFNGYTNGINWLNNTTGGASRSLIARGLFIETASGKSAGMGDLELLRDAAPIEIGNRVWWDQDLDGVQDAGEPPLAGVQVQLKQGNTLLAQQTTDANGLYYFNDYESITTSAQSLTSQLIDTDNDARQNATNVINNATGLYFDNRYFGLRFPNIDIPVGATIASATLRFTASFAGNISNVTIKGYKNPDAAVWTTGNLPFTGSLSDLYTNNATTASVTWNNSNTWVVEASGADQTTPDLTALVQEIVNLPTWQRTKTLAFLINAPANATGATAYDAFGGNTKGAVLSISFTGTTAGNVQPNTAYTLEVPLNQTVLTSNGFQLTTPNAQALAGAGVSSNHAISDVRDSDAALVGGAATIYYTTGSAGQNNHGLDFGFTQPASGQVDILNIAPVPVPDPGGFSISKAIATTDGSSPSVSGTFAVVVSCPGVSGYPATLNLNANGTPVTAGNLVSGTVCSFSENTLTLPNAPTGYTWVNATISPASITIQSNVTATVTARNTLAPLPVAPTNVLTVTKTISGTGSGPFDITIAGPSGYMTNTQIDDGDVLTFNVPSSGLYTVTESTPAGWTTVYTATPGSVSSISGVVTVANENTATLSSTPISGKVFRDYNSDGQITANGTVTDTGVSGVTVTAYDKNGNAVGSATSASDGAYTINPTGDGPYRIEFTNLPSSYKPTTHGTQNGTSTQFVTTAGGATNVNLGILDPCDYCAGLPRIVAQTYVNRDIATAFTRTLVSMPYTVGGVSNGQGHTLPGGFAPYYDPSKVTTVVDAVEMGATFGLAYQRNSRTLFAAAFMKASNGTPATSNGFGPGGPGAIYQIAPGVDGVAGTADDVPTVWLDINNASYTALLGANAAGTDPHVGGTSAQADAEYAAVGKIGFGGMAIGPDDETLYTINLNQRALYILPIGANQAAPAAALITTQDIPYPADCTSGTVGNPDVRPFALTIHRNRGYVGLVCTAESTQDKDALRAYVYPFDLSTGVFGSSVLNEPLTYTRTSLVDPVEYRNRWFAWTVNNTQLVNQPWLTDLQFDGDDLILAFRNRLYDQRGDTPFTNGGDVLRACAVGGVLTLESNGSCGGVAGAGANGQFFAQGAANSPWSLPYGPGGGYYYLPRNSDGSDGELNDSVSNGNRSRLSPALGGLALLPGASDTIITQVDPSEFHNAGLMWVRNRVVEPPANRAGYSIRGFQVLPGNSGPVPGEALFGGKGSGMGDMVLLCDPAPIEIGNRVWDDLDGDGVQDPGEPGLNGVQVTLQAPTGTVGTVNTSSDGNYYFGNLQANTHYTLTITSAPAGYSVTTPNAVALIGASVSSNHAISDTIDSDAVLVGGVATIYYTTGSAGQNNHGLDFGFTQPARGQVDILNIAPAAALVSLGNRVWYDTNNNGTVDSGEQNVGNGVAVELYQDSDSSGGYSAGDSRVASRVTSGGYYTFTGLTPSSSDATRYLVVITATNFLPGGLLSGYHSSTGAVTDNTLAADNDKDHGTLSGVLGQTGGVVASSAISLTAGTQPTGEGNEGNDPIQSSTDANSNQTIDFGFYSLSVGNRVWIDNGGGNSANADNGQLDSGESGLNGVTVELLDSANAVVSTTTTSNGGYYTFTGLISGTYSVRISGYPATYRSSTDTVNASAPTNADDDDNGSGTGTGALTSQPFALVPGSSANGHSANNATGITSNPRIDFGLYEAPASFALDKRLVSPVSGIANIGDAVVYDLVITNTGAITLTSVTLVDSYDADYLQYNSASINPTAQATGVLTWTLTSPTAPLPLSAGETMTVTVTFTAVKP